MNNIEKTKLVMTIFLLTMFLLSKKFKIKKIIPRTKIIVLCKYPWAKNIFVEYDKIVKKLTPIKP